MELITIKIEKCRKKLAKLINENPTLTNKEIVKVSQQLDEHIYLYYESAK
jgi:hypothetical protein